ncbi:TlyA family RNA methyltransferase [Candidatus Sumerlaeota bacterium]|nr:TlyA family RNA methyltransferase [Candidatus Sumerlaeota bacterium]
MKKKTLPAYKLLVHRGLCANADYAKRWIMAGKVIVNDRRIDKAGEQVPENADVRIKGMSRYVGKGGFKLEGALSNFGVTVSGKIALDAGASTGGFTDCLLQHGASRVYAVDVGFGNLAGKLRSDARVVNLEKTNISDLGIEALDPPPSLATVDLSYLSLQKAIPIVSRLLAPDGQLLCLVKPLFETPDAEIRRQGMIADPAIFKEILETLSRFVQDEHLNLLGVTHSPIRGNNGTVEFWLWISKDATASVITAIQLDRTIESALALPDWDKERDGLNS